MTNKHRPALTFVSFAAFCSIVPSLAVAAGFFLIVHGASAAPTNSPSATGHALMVDTNWAIIGPTNAASFRTANGIPSTGDVAVVSATTADLTQRVSNIEATTSNVPEHVASAHEVTDLGGFQGGSTATAVEGGAIGNGASADSGGAVGYQAASINGGGAVGSTAYADGGGAVGAYSKTGHGFAGGRYAYATTDGTVAGDGIDAIQLGTGGNTNAGTLQIYGTQLLNASGKVPLTLLTVAIEGAKLYVTWAGPTSTVSVVSTDGAYTNQIGVYP